MAKKKRQLTEEQRNKEIEEFEKALKSFYYNDEGLGCKDDPYTLEKKCDEMGHRFFDKDSSMCLSSSEIFEKLEEGEPVFVCKFGESDPIQINYENGKLSFGKNMNNLGPQPKAPGFVNRFLSFFGNKKAKEICNTYDQYIVDSQISEKFNENKVKENRELNLNKEKKLQRYANAEKTHKKQKEDIHTEISKIQEENTIEGFESQNRWERVGFNNFCIEVAKLYKLADPKNSEIEIGNLKNGQYYDDKEMLKLGQNLVQNTISQGNYAIFEAMVGKIVTKKTTDQEDKILDNYFSLSHVDEYYRSRPEYKGVDFLKVADPQEPTSVSTFNASANEMFGTKQPNSNFRLTDTKAMLALASHKFNSLNTTVQAKDDSLGKIGAELLRYQFVYNRIATEPDSKTLKFSEDELKSIAHVHLIKQSLKKQTIEGENEIQHLFSNQVRNKSFDTNYKNKALKNGIDIINGSITNFYFKEVLAPRGIKPDEPIGRNDIAKFINDKTNYKLVAQSLLKGATEKFNNYQINTEMATFKVKPKDVDKKQTGPDKNDVQEVIKGEDKTGEPVMQF